EYGPFEEACKRVDMGGKVKYYHTESGVIRYSKFAFSQKLIPMDTMFEKLDSEAIAKIKTEIVPPMMKMIEKIAGQFDEVSVREMMNNASSSTAIHSLMNHMNCIVTWLPYWETSFGELIRIMSQSITGIVGAMEDNTIMLGYPKGGLISYPNALAEGIINCGGEVKTNTGVKRILIEDGKAVGVETDAGEIFKSGIIISNAGIKETVSKLVGKEHFESSYTEKIGKLTPSLAVYCVRLALDKQVMDNDFTFSAPCEDVQEYDRIMLEEKRIPDTLAPIMATSPSIMDPSMAPEGRQLVIVISPCPYGPEDNWPKWEQKALDSIEYSYPGIKDHIIWKDFLTPGTYAALGEEGSPLIGIGQTYKQVGKNRPSSISPVKGLYHVGAEAGKGSSGIGMELASISGLRCADYITGKLTEEV
ncbi:MAG: NAD(P)/FAD-dependent oxidoreductase, partial [Actinobacteria bacterium]|nr:NAD(P)/FAD-dependent oxidoreductase [Actinomycetota bacterium]